MPPARPKPSEIAAEAKRTYIPYIEKRMPEYPVQSFLHADSALTPVAEDRRSGHRLRVAVIDGDPVDVALGWAQYQQTGEAASRIPVVNMANEKRPGGDWESGLMAPEECFARRSNLVHTLVTPYPQANAPPSHYPLPQRGGVYSPNVVVFRDGPDHYELWREFRALPVISVAPVRRPKLDESGTKYSFEQERELMREKLRTVLRIAAWWKHKDICLGGFGIGPIFRNPAGEVAKMWRTLLFQEEEFQGAFENVVFAINSDQPGSSRSGTADLEVFQHEFDPANIFRTQYRS